MTNLSNLGFFFNFLDDISLLRNMELDFLTDPANANLFADTVETNVPETTALESSVSEPNMPEPSLPEAIVTKLSVPETTAKPPKRKQPVTQAASKKRRRNDATQTNKKKEPELVSVHVKFSLVS